MSSVIRIKQYAENAAMNAENPGANPFVDIFNQVVDAESGIVADKSGNIYIADAGRHIIWKLKEGMTPYVFAGAKNVSGYANGVAATARFNTPKNINVDGSGNLFVYDSGNRRIRKLDTNGNVTTVAMVQVSSDANITVSPDGTIFAITS